MKVSTEKPSKIRVLQVIRQGKIGGGESHVLDLISYIDRDQFQPIVLTFTGGQMIKRIKQLGIPHHLIQTETPFDFRVWRKVKDLIESENIDIVHAHGTRANSNVFWACNKLKVPLLYTIHGWSVHPGQNYLIHRLRKAGENFLTGKTDINISVSESNHQTGKQLFKNFDSVIVPYGIDSERFSTSQAANNVKTELGIDGKLSIGFISRMTFQKDPLGMIRGFQLVRKKVPGVKLLMVGDGDLMEKTKLLAKELQLLDDIVFTGFREDVPEILKAIDIFCLPSLWEGLPIGLLEAMAMGKPLVVTAVDGSKNVIRDHENGLLISPEDPNALSEALIELCTNPELRKKIGVNALDTIRSGHLVTDMVDKIQNLYHKVHLK